MSAVGHGNRTLWIAFGANLGITAVFLAYESKALLIGEAADPDLVAAIHDLVLQKDGVASIGEILTVHSAPDQIIAMLSVDFEDHMSAREGERLVCQIEEETAARFPDVDRLYIRPCSAADRDVA